MANIERQIADEIAAANGLRVKDLGLRFDKVVVRLLGNLRAYVERAEPKRQTVLLTITAPIRLAGKTQLELESEIADLLDRKKPIRDRRITVFQNEVRIRIVKPSSKHDNKFVGLVHNPGTDAKLLLDLATKWLIESSYSCEVMPD